MIRRVAQLTPRVKRLVYGWDRDIFKASGLEDFPARRFSLFCVIEDREMPIAACGMLWGYCLVDGKPERIAGFGAVAVRPANQRQGYARQLHGEILEIAKDWGAVGVLAWCQDHVLGLYDRLGAYHVPSVTITRRDGHPAITPQNSLWWALEPRLQAIGHVDVQGPRW